MIDFPASPTTGQTYLGANGITYMWTGTIWVATAPSGTSPGGDFSAVKSAGIGFGTTANTVVLYDAIRSGNSGNWYVPATGRFTPPAGRYYMNAVSAYDCAGATGSTLAIFIRKNGVTELIRSQTTIVNAGWAEAITVNGTFDANGTDYFEVLLAASVANVIGTIAGQSSFTAFPISGIKGPPGDPGQLGFRLLQRTVVSSAVADVSIQNIPTDINDLKFTFDLTPVNNATAMILQFYGPTGVLINGAGNYAGAVTYATHNQSLASAPSAISSNAIAYTNGVLLNPSNSGRNVSNTASGGIRGSGTIPNIRSATRHKSVDFQSNHLSDDLTVWLFSTGNGVRNFEIFGPLTGIRLSFGSGNVASGAFSVWGSP